MSRPIVSAAAALAVAALVVACSSPSPQSAACRQAAEDQAFAEQRLTQLIEQHLHDDAALAEDPTAATAVAAHDESAGLVVGSRIDMILAEAETRHRCG